MFRLLNFFAADQKTDLSKTKLIVKYYLDIPGNNESKKIFSFSGNNGYEGCTITDDFENTYKLLLATITVYRKKFPETRMVIILSGKLNGNKISETLDDLNSYKDFLISNDLLTESNSQMEFGL